MASATNITPAPSRSALWIASPLLLSALSASYAVYFGSILPAVRDWFYLLLIYRTAVLCLQFMPRVRLPRCHAQHARACLLQAAGRRTVEADRTDEGRDGRWNDTWRHYAHAFVHCILLLPYARHAACLHGLPAALGVLPKTPTSSLYLAPTSTVHYARRCYGGMPAPTCYSCYPGAAHLPLISLRRRAALLLLPLGRFHSPSSRSCDIVAGLNCGMLVGTYDIHSNSSGNIWWFVQPPVSSLLSPVSPPSSQQQLVPSQPVLPCTFSGVDSV